MTSGGEEAVPGTVYLVGAGPGDPGLLTLRAARLLSTASLILPDDLVSKEILSLASAFATVIAVGKRCGEARITQYEINRLMIEGAQNRHSVVRLKSGDPLVFGRAGEELSALAQEGIPYEIIPGITAAFAAAASLRTPLTDRTSASKLIFATAHHAANRAALDSAPEPLWKGPLPADATLAIYMPGRDFEELARQLIHSGMDADTPCAAISQASRSEETVSRTSLRALRNDVAGPSPVLLLIGRTIQPRS